MPYARRRSSTRSTLNDRLLLVVLLVLAVAPLLFGSNRPAFWALWGVVLGLSGLWWFRAMMKTDRPFRIAPQKEWALQLVFTLMALFMIVQVVPLPSGFLPPPLSTPTVPDLDLVARTISLTPGDTLHALLRWVTYGLLFFMVMQLAANRSRAESLLRGVFWIVVLHALVGLAFRFQFGDTLLGLPKESYLGSATGGFVNRNSYATFLAMGAVAGAALVLEKILLPAHGRDPKASWLDAYLGLGGVVQLLIGWLAILAALFASNSRMGVAAALAGLTVLLVLALAKARRGSVGLATMLTVGAMMATIAALLVLHGQTLIERLGDTSQDTDIRMEIYRQVMDMIRVRPLTGFGGNSFEHVYPLFHDYPVDVNLIWDKTHNSYLSNWVEYGLIFGSLPLLLCALVLFRILKDYVRSQDADVICLAAVGTIAVGAVHSLVDFSLEIEAVTFLFTALMAAGFARATVRLEKGTEA